jgi:cephalosporin hydroxylase
MKSFNKLYYHGPTGTPLYTQLTWLGVGILKCPADLLIYQEILWKTQPDIIVECGVFYGGSSLFLASICDLIGKGTVLGIDISLKYLSPRARQHPRLEFWEGSSTDPAIFQAVAQRCQGKKTMVILDSDHSEPHVLKELQLYSDIVSDDCYLICEDTNVNGHPVLADHGPGPFEAVETFLFQNPECQSDKDCERLLVDCNSESGSRVSYTTAHGF